MSIAWFVDWAVCQLRGLSIGRYVNWLVSGLGGCQMGGWVILPESIESESLMGVN